MNNEPTFDQKLQYIERWLKLEPGAHLLMSIADANYWYTKIKLQEERERATKQPLSTDGNP